MNKLHFFFYFFLIFAIGPFLVLALHLKIDKHFFFQLQRAFSALFGKAKENLVLAFAFLFFLIKTNKKTYKTKKQARMISTKHDDRQHNRENTKNYIKCFQIST